MVLFDSCAARTWCSAIWGFQTCTLRTAMQSRHDGSVSGPGWLASEPVPTGRTQLCEKRTDFLLWDPAVDHLYFPLVTEGTFWGAPKVRLRLFLRITFSHHLKVSVLYMNILGVKQKELFSHFILVFWGDFWISALQRPHGRTDGAENICNTS